MKVSNRFLGLFVILILVVPVGAFATGPRTSALGGDNTFFEDDSNVLRWYGSLCDYGDQVLVGTGHHDFAESGVSWKDSESGFGTGVHVDLASEGKWGTAAFYFNEQMRDSDVSTSIEDDPGDSFTVMYGRKVGPVLVGLALRHGSREWSVAIDTFAGRPLSHREFGRTTVGIGLRADLSSSSYLDVSFDLHRINWLDASLNHDAEGLDSWKNLSLRARAFFAIGTNMALVPVVEFWSEDYLTLLESFDFSEAHENKMLRMGCGLNFFPNSDNFMLVSANYLGLQDNTDGVCCYDFSKRINQFNLLIATETRWNHWLTLRASASCQYFKREDEVGAARDLNNTIFPLSFGAGFHLGGFDLDMALASHEPGLLNPNWDSLYSDEPSVQARGAWFSASLRYLF